MSSIPTFGAWSVSERGSYSDDGAAYIKAEDEWALAGAAATAGARSGLRHAENPG